MTRKEWGLIAYGLALGFCIAMAIAANSASRISPSDTAGMAQWKAEREKEEKDARLMDYLTPPISRAQRTVYVGEHRLQGVIALGLDPDSVWRVIRVGRDGRP